MKKDNVYYYAILLILGTILLALGIFVLGESTKSVSGLCIGIGAGLIGMNIANFIIYQYYRRNPKIKKQSEIESKDERCIFITNKAKAKAFDVTIRILLVIPFLLILTDSSLWMILTTIAIYIFGFGVQIYYTVKFGKEM